MRSHPGEAGSATPLAIIVTAVLLIVAVVLSSYAAVSLRPLQRVETASEDQRQVAEVVTRVIELLHADQSPEADSRNDPVYREFGPDAGGAAVIRDLSSLVNPNWVQTFFLDRSSLGHIILQPGVVAAELQTARLTEGFSMLPDRDFTDLLTEDALADLVSPYSYLNVNTSGESELERVYLERTGSAADAAAFRSRVQEVRSRLGTVGEDDLFSLLTPHYDEVFPFVNAFPRYNIHHVDERILEAVLSYPAFEIAHWRSAFSALVGSGSSGEVTAEQIRATLRVASDHRVMQYLGTTTWFWELRVPVDDGVQIVIIARIPGLTRADDSLRVVGMFGSRDR